MAPDRTLIDRDETVPMRAVNHRVGRLVPERVAIFSSFRSTDWAGGRIIPWSAGCDEVTLFSGPRVKGNKIGWLVLGRGELIFFGGHFQGQAAGFVDH